MPWDAAGPRNDPFWALLGRQITGVRDRKKTDPLSSVQVNPERYMRTGTLVVGPAFGGRNKLKFVESPPRAADYIHQSKEGVLTENCDNQMETSTGVRVRSSLAPR